AQPSDSPLFRRFEQEVRTWIEIGGHPNITEAIGIHWAAGQLLLELEYVDGGDLGTLIDQSGSHDLRTILTYSLNFCDGMNHATEHGLSAHRDIKPANCLLSTDGSLKISDFGIAKLRSIPARVFSGETRPGVGSDVTTDGAVMGTPAY